MKELRLIWAVILCILVTPLFSYAASFNINPPLGTRETSNSLGLAVNPANNNIFLTSLSYTAQGGTDNLWEFTSTGSLVYSTRTVFDTGATGNLGSITIANNGHLFAVANSSDPGPVRRNIVEMSLDGNTIFSSFSTDQYLGGTFGVTYNSIDDVLIVATGRVGTEYVLRKIMLDGTLLSSFSLDKNLWPYAIAFDAHTGNLFSIRGDWSDQFPLLDEFARRGQVEYQLIRTYDMRSVGIYTLGLAMDISRTTGLFYVNEGNSTVVEFDRKDLVLATIPTSATIDIRPNKTPNTINTKSRGSVSVAVLTEGEVDALQVDPDTVKFGPNEATVTRTQVKDVDRDGDVDLLLKFSNKQTGIACSDTEATLTGELYHGSLISGTDSIQTKGCR